MPTNIERGSYYGRSRFMRVKTRDAVTGKVTVTRELYGTLSQAKKSRRLRARTLRKMATIHEALLPVKTPGLLGIE